MAAQAAIAAQVGEFYERHPYPPPVDDIDAYRRRWDDARRRADSHLFWPDEPYRDDRSILVAGCGTAQAAHYAVRWPNAHVVGIDVSATSIAFAQNLKEEHGLENLELRKLPVEHATDLDRAFDHVVCTGVLHHLPDPDAGLRALRDVLAPSGAMHVMVYASYGRAGVYMLAEYCRRLGVEPTETEIADLAATLKALPPDHPLVPLLRGAPDLSSTAGLADALLHPLDRAYTVAQFVEYLDRAGVTLGRWIRQAPYLPSCGAIASTPHRDRLAALSPFDQYAAIEVLRGTMVRHAAVVYPKESARSRQVSFDDDAWRRYVPVPLPDTIAVRDRLPEGAAAVLINRNHTYTDLYLPIDIRQQRLMQGIDGKRTIEQICVDGDRERARAFFEQLWRWDQVVFDASRLRDSA